SDAATQFAGELYPDHIGGEKIHRLAKHGGFGLDATHAPGNHANAIDHGGVTVGTHQGVWVVNVVFLVHAASQIFKVDLMDDAKPGRHDAKGIEGLHAPFHELVAFLIALELHFHVQIQCFFCAEIVDHDRVLHHQVDRDQGFDPFWIPAHFVGDRPHGSKVGQQWYAGKVLQDDTG